MNHTFNSNQEQDAYKASSHIIKTDLSVFTPINLKQLSLNYLAEFFIQFSNYELPSQEQFFIGSRNTVRGFNGNYSLFGNKGGYFRNTIAWNIPNSVFQPYIGLDYGRVVQNNKNSHKNLVGSAIGLKVSKGKTKLDTFIAMPVHRPASFPDKPFLGFSLNWTY